MASVRPLWLCPCVTTAKWTLLKVGCYLNILCSLGILCWEFWYNFKIILYATWLMCETRSIHCGFRVAVCQITFIILQSDTVTSPHWTLFWEVMAWISRYHQRKFLAKWTVILSSRDNVVYRYFYISLCSHVFICCRLGIVIYVIIALV